MRGTGQILHSIVHTPPMDLTHTHTHIQPAPRFFSNLLCSPWWPFMIGDQIVPPKEKIYMRIKGHSSFYGYSWCFGYVLESVLYLE